MEQIELTLQNLSCSKNKYYYYENFRSLKNFGSMVNIIFMLFFLLANLFDDIIHTW